MIRVPLNLPLFVDTPYRWIAHVTSHVRVHSLMSIKNVLLPLTSLSLALTMLMNCLSVYTSLKSVMCNLKVSVWPLKVMLCNSTGTGGVHCH